MSSLPTGEQYSLRRGDVTATVTELAASLRSLRVDGLALVDEYPDELVHPGGSGIVLVPWPNRVADGRWVLDGEVQQLDITEPSKGNASHGLLRNTGYTVADRTDDSVTLAAGVFPQHGWPFRLGTSVRYQLSDDGVTVTHTVVNRGPRPAPVAVGAHPYLRVGDTPVEELVLTVAAASYLESDERGIPVHWHPVEGAEQDLRGGRRIGDVRLDNCYTGLTSTDGVHRHRLQAPSGDGVELWAEEPFGYAQVYTNVKYPGQDGPRLAVAVEPMTAPADALNSGDGLVRLEPGAEWTLSWGLRRS